MSVEVRIGHDLDVIVLSVVAVGTPDDVPVVGVVGSDDAEHAVDLTRLLV